MWRSLEGVTGLELWQSRQWEESGALWPGQMSNRELSAPEAQVLVFFSVLWFHVYSRVRFLHFGGITPLRVHTPAEEMSSRTLQRNMEIFFSQTRRVE